jgi:hypothetical protein
VKDCIGREIKAGNLVVYPVRKGSKMWMSKMTVDSTEGGRLRGTNPEGRLVQLANVSNVVVVQPLEVID